MNVFVMICIVVAVLIVLTDDAGSEDHLCRGKITITTDPVRLIYGCMYQVQGIVLMDSDCKSEYVHSRLRIIGKYNSGWTKGARKVSYPYMAFVAGTVDVVFEWVCVKCGAHGRKGKRFPIGG